MDILNAGSGNIDGVSEKRVARSNPSLRFGSVSSAALVGLVVMSAPPTAIAVTIASSLAMISCASGGYSCAQTFPIPGNPLGMGVTPKAFADVTSEDLSYDKRNKLSSPWGENQLLNTDEDRCELEGGVSLEERTVFFKQSWARTQFNEAVASSVGLETPQCSLGTIHGGAVMNVCEELLFIDALPKETNVPPSLRKKVRGNTFFTHRADHHFPIEDSNTPNYDSIVIDMAAIFGLVPHTHFDDLVMSVSGGLPTSDIEEPFERYRPAVIDLDGLPSRRNTYLACKHMYNILKRVPVHKQKEIIKGVNAKIKRALEAIEPASNVFSGVTASFLKENKAHFWPYYQNHYRNDMDPSGPSIAQFDVEFNDLVGQVEKADSLQGLIINRSIDRLNYLSEFLKSIYRDLRKTDMSRDTILAVYKSHLDNAVELQGRLDIDIALVSVVMGLEVVHISQAHEEL